jgi:hypothetical protein
MGNVSGVNNSTPAKSPTLTETVKKVGTDFATSNVVKGMQKILAELTKPVKP